MKSLAKAYQGFSFKMNAVVRILCIVFFVIMVIDVVASVIMRYVLVKPMVWGEQLAVYCMIWIAFLSSSIAFRRGAHMGLDLLVKHTPPKFGKFLQAVAHMMVIAFLVIFIVWGFKHAYAVREQISPVVFNMSMMWAYIALPIGGFCMLTQEIGVIVNGLEEDA